MNETITGAQENKSISVALTTYNGGKYLLPQLMSVARQTQAPAELVVCDDGSTDETLTILRDFARIAPFPVHVHCNIQKLGFRANFMQCAHRCVGDLVAFCDQDDVWMHSKLEVQRHDFRDPSVMLSCHNANLVDRQGTLINRRLDQYPESRILDFNSAGPILFPRGFTQIIRKDIIKWDWLRQNSIDIGNIYEMMSHDGWFFFLALLHGTVAYHHEALVSYRQHGDNASGAVPSKRAMFLARFASRPGDFHRLARVWANRCDMLQDLIEQVPELDPPVRARADQLLTMYRRSATAAAARTEFYAAPTLWRKATLLAQAVLRGDFKGRDPWAFPPGAILKDAAFVLSNFDKPSFKS